MVVYCASAGARTRVQRTAAPFCSGGNESQRVMLGRVGKGLLDAELLLIVLRAFFLSQKVRVPF